MFYYWTKIRLVAYLNKNYLIKSPSTFKFHDNQTAFAEYATTFLNFLNCLRDIIGCLRGNHDVSHVR